MFAAACTRIITQFLELKKRYKTVSKQHKLDAPLGVRGRNSNNDLIRENLGGDYSQSLEEGIRKTYTWIQSQIEKKNYIPFHHPV
jgi:hypothetical protein